MVRQYPHGKFRSLGSGRMGKNSYLCPSSRKCLYAENENPVADPRPGALHRSSAGGAAARGSRPGARPLRLRPVERCPARVSPGAAGADPRGAAAPAGGRLLPGGLRRGAGRGRCRGVAPGVRGALSRLGLRQRRALLAGVVLLHDRRHAACARILRADRLPGIEPLAPRAVRHPHGVCRVRRGRLRPGLRPFRPHRRPQRICRPCALLPLLHRLREGALRPGAAGLLGSAAERRLPLGRAVLPAPDRVPQGQLPLRRRPRRRAGSPLGARTPCGARAGHRRVVVPSGRLQPHARTPRGLCGDGRRDGSRRLLPQGFLALPHGALCRGGRVAAQGVRCGGRADAERLLPPGRLLPARGRQAGGDAGLRHGGRREVRRCDCRGCPLQLRQAAI